MKKCVFFIEALIFLSIISLVGCVTPYQPSGYQGGYSDMALSENIYKVSFRGNGYTSSERVKNYLLRRCSELTLSKGYKYFVILQSNIINEGYTYQTPSTVDTSIQGNAYTNGYYNFGTANATSTINPGREEKVDEYTGTVLIKMLMSNKNEPYALNAAVIQSNFKQ